MDEMSGNGVNVAGSDSPSDAIDHHAAEGPAGNSESGDGNPIEDIEDNVEQDTGDLHMVLDGGDDGGEEGGEGDGSDSDDSSSDSGSPGDGNQDESGGFTVFFGNPTGWGPQARTFIERSSDDMVGLVETHIDERRLLEHEGLRLKGRATFWSPAIQDEHSTHPSMWANRGGAMWAAMTSMSATTLGSARGSDGIDTDLGIGTAG